MWNYGKCRPHEDDVCVGEAIYTWIGSLPNTQTIPHTYIHTYTHTHEHSHATIESSYTFSHIYAYAERDRFLPRTFIIQLHFKKSITLLCLIN